MVGRAGQRLASEAVLSSLPAGAPCPRAPSEVGPLGRAPFGGGPSAGAADPADAGNEVADAAAFWRQAGKLSKTLLDPQTHSLSGFGNREVSGSKHKLDGK